MTVMFLNILPWYDLMHNWLSSYNKHNLCKNDKNEVLSNFIVFWASNGLDIAYYDTLSDKSLSDKSDKILAWWRTFDGQNCLKKLC